MPYFGTLSYTLILLCRPHSDYTLLHSFPTLSHTTLATHTLCPHSHPTLWKHSHFHYALTLPTLCHTLTLTMILHFVYTLILCCIYSLILHFATLYYAFCYTLLHHHLLHFVYTLILHFATLHLLHSTFTTFFLHLPILHSTTLFLLHFTALMCYTLILHFTTLLCTLWPYTLLHYTCYTLSTLLSYTWLDYICYTLLRFCLHSDPTLCLHSDPILCYTTLATLCLHSDPTLCYTILATLCLHSYPTLYYIFSTLTYPTLYYTFFPTLCYTFLCYPTLYYTFPLSYTFERPALKWKVYTFHKGLHFLTFGWQVHHRALSSNEPALK